MKLKSNSLYELFVALAIGASTLLAQPEAKAETVKGEVVDLMCYLDHGAHGDKHAACAQKCIKSGGPVGILTADNKLYLIVGDHKPMNDELAAVAAQTVTITGKVVSRDGMNMIENAVIEK